MAATTTRNTVVVVRDGIEYDFKLARAYRKTKSDGSWCEAIDIAYANNPEFAKNMSNKTLKILAARSIIEDEEIVGCEIFNKRFAKAKKTFEIFSDTQEKALEDEVRIELAEEETKKAKKKAKKEKAAKKSKEESEAKEEASENSKDEIITVEPTEYIDLNKKLGVLALKIFWKVGEAGEDADPIKIAKDEICNFVTENYTLLDHKSKKLVDALMNKGDFSEFVKEALENNNMLDTLGKFSNVFGSVVDVEDLVKKTQEKSTEEVSDPVVVDAVIKDVTPEKEDTPAPVVKEEKAEAPKKKENKAKEEKKEDFKVESPFIPEDNTPLTEEEKDLTVPVPKSLIFNYDKLSIPLKAPISKDSKAVSKKIAKVDEAIKGCVPPNMRYEINPLTTGLMDLNLFYNGTFMATFMVDPNVIYGNGIYVGCYGCVEDRSMLMIHESDKPMLTKLLGGGTFTISEAERCREKIFDNTNAYVYIDMSCIPHGIEDVSYKMLGSNLNAIIEQLIARGISVPRLGFKSYQSPTKFILVSDGKVKSPRADMVKFVTDMTITMSGNEVTVASSEEAITFSL